MSLPCCVPYGASFRNPHGNEALCPTGDKPVCEGHDQCRRLIIDPNAKRLIHSIASLNTPQANQSPPRAVNTAMSTMLWDTGAWYQQGPPALLDWNKQRQVVWIIGNKQPAKCGRWCQILKAGLLTFDGDRNNKSPLWLLGFEYVSSKAPALKTYTLTGPLLVQHLRPTRAPQAWVPRGFPPAAPSSSSADTSSVVDCID